MLAHNAKAISIHNLKIMKNLTNRGEVSPDFPAASVGAQENVCELCMGMCLRRKGHPKQKSKHGLLSSF